MKFISKAFSELNTKELFEIYYLRSLVFVVEQNCPYQDVDEHDKKARHVMLWQDEQLAAYARLIPAEGSYKEPKIGRVVVHPDHRKKGIARQLMFFCLQQCAAEFKCAQVVISAQVYLEKFYSGLGFKTEDEVYDEDGIPHQKMRYSY